ncbi:MAG TPA: PASTA domain-containing protein [Acidimicrobiales bacterium]|nr:PASTA domain-containing protein [Acidimicrobiales bacterium]
MTRMTDQIGRVLGGRYRLLSPLGSGASAQVYLADDVRLRRQVAVKVLHPGLADDESFLRRFRAEAQATAALSHPHLLAVFDWSDDEVPYLVTEYLGGGSLRSMLDRGHRLSSAQALVIGLEAARALDYAHRQGFVHRDIKPANLLFGEDARLRIADFGLARAIAEAGWTEPAGAVLGTARYASPEQARGESVDGRSDVYSLALVLTEAVTGQVPFTTDTTIGTLMARLDRDMEVPDSLGPLASVVRDAGRLDPGQRLDAADLGKGLVAAATQLKRPEPLPLTGTDVPEAAEEDERDTTLLGPSARRTPPPADPGAATTVVAGAAVAGATAGAAVASPPGSGATAVADRPRVPGEFTGSEATSVMGGPTTVPPPPGPPPGPRPWDTGNLEPRRGLSAGDRSVRRLMLSALVVAAAVVFGVVGAALYMQAQVPSHTVPATLVGAQFDDAVNAVEDFDWEVEAERVRQDGTQPGQVLASKPAAGERLKEGSTLTLTVSDGPTLVPVPPNLLGMTEDDARAALQAVELGVSFVPAEAGDAEEGTVIGFADYPGAAPPAEGLPKGTTVKLQIATDDDMEIPDLIGDDYQDAVAVLEDLGLSVQVVGQRPEGDQEPGTVIGLDPGEGTEVEPGASVRVTVAVDQVAVPQVTGMTIEEARAEVERAGLTVGNVLGPNRGRVLFTAPGAGSEVDLGTAVTLITRPRGD